jgi:hypothetical protein
VQLAYIDDSGAVVGVGSISPGQVYTASTNVGDYWVVKNSGGGCLAVVDVGGSGTATVT